MKNELSEEYLEKKSRALNRLLRGVVNGSINIPDNAVIFTDHEVLAEIITKKRLELLRVINESKPQSVQELADLTKRKKQAVDRDLKILEKYELVELRKNGRKRIPVIIRPFVFLPLTDMPPINNKLKTSNKSETMLHKEGKRNRAEVIKATS